MDVTVFLVILLLVVVSHLAGLKLLPAAFVGRISGQMLKQSGGHKNVIFGGAPVDHNSRAVVIPCPDFLYSYGVLGLGPRIALRITMPASENLQYGNLGIYDSR